mgnify:CR=1 FL=1
MSSISEATYQTPKLPRTFKGGKNTPRYPQYSPFDYDKSEGGQKRWDKNLVVWPVDRNVKTPRGLECLGCLVEEVVNPVCVEINIFS